jgi:amidohydrolase
MIHTEMEQAFSIAKSLGGNYELEIKAGSPPTINDPQIAKVVLGATEDLFGKEYIQEHKPVMYGDDYARYGQLVPAGYFFVGCEIHGDARKHHDSRFDIDETCLPVGVAVLAESALRMLC